MKRHLRVPFLFPPIGLNMKKTISLFVLFLVGCAQLQRGQMQPVITKSYKDKIYFTTCSGGAEDWGTCHSKAREACSGDYNTVYKYEAIKGTVIRELTFQCKK